MKRVYLIILLATFALCIFSQQASRSDVLQNLEKSANRDQEKVLTAKLRQASRLFGSKDDLTSVIVVLPAGTMVTITGSDEDYYHVKYEDTEGYILKKHAEIDLTPVKELEEKKQADIQKQAEPPAKEMTRFEYLEKKYGTRIATQIYAGKIWKGMTSQMVLDSWGRPQKINRAITGNLTREEWIYKNTWLFIDNNILVEWGPIKR